MALGPVKLPSAGFLRSALRHPAFRLGASDMLATGVAATAALAAFALPLKLNILVAVAAAICTGLLVEALEE